MRIDRAATMSIERQKAFGVIDALPDPHASILENYILRLERERDEAQKGLEVTPVTIALELQVKEQKERIEELERELDEARANQIPPELRAQCLSIKEEMETGAEPGYRARLENVVKAVLAATEEELRHNLQEAGLDPDEEVRNLRRIASQAIQARICKEDEDEDDAEISEP